SSAIVRSVMPIAWASVFFPSRQASMRSRRTSSWRFFDPWRRSCCLLMGSLWIPRSEPTVVNRRSGPQSARARSTLRPGSLFLGGLLLRGLLGRGFSGARGLHRGRLPDAERSAGGIEEDAERSRPRHVHRLDHDLRAELLRLADRLLHA